MSTRLAKDSARAVVASEQASAIRANFTTMCFMVFRLWPSIHLLDVRPLSKSRLVIFYWARRRNKSTVKPPILSSVAVPLAATGHERHFRAVRRTSAYPLTAAENQTFSNRSFGPTTDIRLTNSLWRPIQYRALAAQGLRPLHAHSFAGLQR